MRISDWSSDVCSSDLVDYDAMANGHGRFYAGQSPIRGRIQKVGSDAVDPIDAMTERLMLIVDGMDAMTPLLISRYTATSALRSEEHTSELQSLMRNSYAVFCLKQKKNQTRTTSTQ